MNRRLVPLHLCLALLLLGTIAAAAPLTGEVVSDTGQGLAARVMAYNPATRESALVYTSPVGKFSLEVPAGKLQVRASHGPEWTIAEVEADSAENKPLSLVLRRLVDMPARGYYGTDLHMHSTASDGKQPPIEVAYACQAEGLHVAALTDHWAVAGHEEWLRQQAALFLPLRGQENSTGMGHIVAVNTPTLNSHVEPTTAETILGIFKQIHDQAGFAIVAHPNVPGQNYQTPDIKEYDALEILNGSLPPHGPVFDFVQGRKAWHEMLSQGLRVPVVGDSDCHDVLNGTGRRLLQAPDELQQLDKRLALLARLIDFEKTMVPWAFKVHSGAYRTYLQLPELTPAAVQTAVKQGNGFVTSGPLLLATLDGKVPGNDIAVAGRESVTLSAEMFGNRPLEKLVILINGQPGMEMQSNAAQTQVTVPVKAGDWVTAELYGPWPEFATTNAWYIKQ